MGGLKAHLPVTYWTYVIATLAIAGIPLTAGFFSKDLILWRAFDQGAYALWAIGWITAAITAFYMFRQLFMVFHGACRADAHTQAHLHESPAVMTGPLVVLAAGSVFAGWLGAPEYLWGSRWADWLGAVFPAAEHHGSFASEITVTILTVAAVLVAIYLAFRKYGGGAAKIGRTGENFMYRLALNKYYVDEIYDYLVVRPFTATARFFAEFFDPWVIDGTVNGIAAVARGFSWLSHSLQTGNVQHYIAGFLVGALALLAYYIGEL